MKPLRVCVDARLVSGEAGGVEQFIIGLANGLSNLTDGSEEYLFLVYADSQDWLLPFLSGPCRILEDKTPSEELFIPRMFRGMEVVWNSILPPALQVSVHQIKSGGTIEYAEIDVMHFTLQQQAFLTTIPSIYHPHDLQHIHLPEFFSWRTRLARDQKYRSFCKQAKMVVVASRFGKQDLVQNYHLPAEKVKVVNLAPVVVTYPEPDLHDLAKIRMKYSLPENYIFYPAQTWPHKNHISLLKALSLLRNDSGIKIPAVFSGTKNEFYITIEEKIRELDLEDQVRFLGFVEPSELKGLYKLCRGVVLPTKFEAASFPLWEAFLMGVPAICSNVTSLPEQAGDAALLFDPDNPEEIAYQLHKLWTDEKLRSVLIKNGRQNISRFSWNNTARTFRAHYRRLAKHSLTSEDKELLSSPSFF